MKIIHDGTVKIEIRSAEWGCDNCRSTISSTLGEGILCDQGTHVSVVCPVCDYVNKIPFKNFKV